MFFLNRGAAGQERTIDMIVKIVDIHTKTTRFFESEEVGIRKTGLFIKDLPGGYNEKQLLDTYLADEMIGDPFVTRIKMGIVVEMDEKAVLVCAGRIYLLNQNGSTVDSYVVNLLKRRRIEMPKPKVA